MIRRLVLLAMLAAVVWDFSRPAAQQWSADAAVAAIHAYQRIGAPLVRDAGVRCRFTTTCSHYAERAIRKDGFVLGVGRAIGRVARCGPWTPMGSVDEP